MAKKNISALLHLHRFYLTQLALRVYFRPDVESQYHLLVREVPPPGGFGPTKEGSNDWEVFWDER